MPMATGQTVKPKFKVLRRIVGEGVERTVAPVLSRRELHCDGDLLGLIGWAGSGSGLSHAPISRSGTAHTSGPERADGAGRIIRAE